MENFEKFCERVGFKCETTMYNDFTVSEKDGREGLTHTLSKCLMSKDAFCPHIATERLLVLYHKMVINHLNNNVDLCRWYKTNIELDKKLSRDFLKDDLEGLSFYNTWTELVEKDNFDYTK